MKRRNGKYNARKVEHDGYTFDSYAECGQYNQLVLRQRAGEIEGLKVHPVYLLQGKFRRGKKTIRPITYEADFEYREDGRIVAEDVKGVKTEAFKIKQKLFLYKYPQIELRIVEV